MPALENASGLRPIYGAGVQYEPDTVEADTLRHDRLQVPQGYGVLLRIR